MFLWCANCKLTLFGYNGSNIFFTYTHDSYLGFQGGKYIKCVTLNNSH